MTAARPGRQLEHAFRGFAVPMGLAVLGDRLALGTKLQVWELRN